MKPIIDPKVQELKRKDVWNLFGELLFGNILLSYCINFEYPNCDEDLEKLVHDTTNLSDLIKKRPKSEREAYFMSGAKLVCIYYEDEKYKEVGKDIAELRYYQHCFLEDSELKKRSLSYKNLKKLIDSNYQ